MSAFPKTYKVIVSDNDKVRACWFNAGNLLHNEEGPAVVYANSDVEYRQNGKLHRVGGPAVIFIDGHQEWYQYDMLHNEEGPAVVYKQGATITHVVKPGETGYVGGVKVDWAAPEYWLEGFEYDKEEWEEELKRRQGLGLLLSSDKKAVKQYECMECDAVYYEPTPMCAECMKAGEVEGNAADLHEKCVELGLVDKKPEQWSWKTNPTPPKHPFCGECGL